MSPQLGKGGDTGDSVRGGEALPMRMTHEDHRAWGVTWQCLRGEALTMPTQVVWDRT